MGGGTGTRLPLAIGQTALISGSKTQNRLPDPDTKRALVVAVISTGKNIVSQLGSGLIRLVWYSAAGDDPIEPFTLHSDCKALLVKARLPAAMRFHNLTHDGLLAAILRGSSQAGAGTSGHANVGVTMSTNLHFLEASRRQTAETVAQSWARRCR
jgi:hypothetical protein